MTAGLAGLATVWCRSCDGPVQSGAGLATVRAGLFCTSRAKDLCAVRPKDTDCAQYYEQFIKDEKKILSLNNITNKNGIVTAIDMKYDP